MRNTPVAAERRAETQRSEELRSDASYLRTHDAVPSLLGNHAFGKSLRTLSGVEPAALHAIGTIIGNTAGRALIDGPQSLAEQEADVVAEQLLSDSVPALPIRERAAPSAQSSQVADALANLSSSGKPLPDLERQHFEESLGTDLGSVRVHDNAGAHILVTQLGANAFTYGRHIYFRKGAYDLSDSSGQHRLAHEVVHTVQQSRGAPVVQLQGNGRATRASPRTVSTARRSGQRAEVSRFTPATARVLFALSRIDVRLREFAARFFHIDRRLLQMLEIPLASMLPSATTLRARWHAMENQAGRCVREPSAQHGRAWLNAAKMVLEAANVLRDHITGSHNVPGSNSGRPSGRPLSAGFDASGLLSRELLDLGQAALNLHGDLVSSASGYASEGEREAQAAAQARPRTSLQPSSRRPYERTVFWLRQYVYGRDGTGGRIEDMRAHPENHVWTINTIFSTHYGTPHSERGSPRGIRQFLDRLQRDDAELYNAILLDGRWIRSRQVWANSRDTGVLPSMFRIATALVIGDWRSDPDPAAGESEPATGEYDALGEHGAITMEEELELEENVITAGHLAVTAPAGFIPIVGQILDARDVSGNLYHLIQGHRSWTRWLSFVFSLIGIVPGLGDGIRAVARSSMRWGPAALGRFSRLLRHLDAPTAAAIVDTFRQGWPGFVERVLTKWDDIVRNINRRREVLQIIVEGHLLNAWDEVVREGRPLIAACLVRIREAASNVLAAMNPRIIEAGLALSSAAAQVGSRVLAAADAVAERVARLHATGRLQLADRAFEENYGSIASLREELNRALRSGNESQIQRVAQELQSVLDNLDERLQRLGLPTAPTGSAAPAPRALGEETSLPGATQRPHEAAENRATRGREIVRELERELPSLEAIRSQVRDRARALGPSSEPGYQLEIPLGEDRFWRRSSGGQWCYFASPPHCPVGPESQVIETALLDSMLEEHAAAQTALNHALERWRLAHTQQGRGASASYAEAVRAARRRLYELEPERNVPDTERLLEMGTIASEATPPTHHASRRRVAALENQLPAPQRSTPDELLQTQTSPQRSVLDEHPLSQPPGVQQRVSALENAEGATASALADQRAIASDLAGLPNVREQSTLNRGVIEALNLSDSPEALVGYREAWRSGGFVAESRTQSARLERALHRFEGQGDVVLPPLHREEEVQLLRLIEEGRIALEPTRRGRHLSITIRGGSTQRGHMYLNVDMETGVASLSRGYVTGAGAYGGRIESRIQGQVDERLLGFVPNEVVYGTALRTLPDSLQRLLRTLEPARRPGMPTSYLIAEEMARAGRGSARDFLGGQYAPMGFSGATSSGGVSETAIRARGILDALEASFAERPAIRTADDAALYRLSRAYRRFRVSMERARELDNGARARTTESLVHHFSVALLEFRRHFRWQDSPRYSVRK